MVFVTWLGMTSNDFGTSGCGYCHAGKEHSKLQIQNYSGELKNMNVEKYRKCKRQEKMKCMNYILTS